MAIAIRHGGQQGRGAIGIDPKHVPEIAADVIGVTRDIAGRIGRLLELPVVEDIRGGIAQRIDDGAGVAVAVEVAVITDPCIKK
jgi:hypothetical protein